MIREQEHEAIRGTMEFACGAVFVGVEDPREVASHTDRDGRCRWVVYDSEPGPTSPRLNGDLAPCLHGCKHKRAGKRKQWRGFPPEGSAARWQTWVTCYGAWRPT
jgi:hypothetical protein